MTKNVESQPDQRDAMLDRALASYTPLSAPPGLEQRLLAQLAAAPNPHQRRQPAILYWALAASVLIAVAVGVAVFENRRSEPGPLVTVNVLHNGSSTPQDARKGSRVPAGKAARIRSRISPEEAIALSEMRAPSHPAPEAPLTPEEKLLQAHRSVRRSAGAGHAEPGSSRKTGSRG